MAAFVAAKNGPKHQHGDKGHAGHKRGELAAMTTTQRLDLEAEREARRNQRHQERANAVRNFYAALSPDQKPVFDALQRMRGHGEHGPRPREFEHRFGPGRDGPSGEGEE